MKIRFLFLIGIQLFLMFPRPGMQNISHATNRAGAKHTFYDDVFKFIIYKDMIQYRIAENKKYNWRFTLYNSSADSFETSKNEMKKLLIL